jgi:ankyrin repeat protein
MSSKISSLDIFQFDERKYGSVEKLRRLLRDNIDSSNLQILPILNNMVTDKNINSIMGLLLLAVEENNLQFTLELIAEFFGSIISDRQTILNGVTSLLKVRLFKSIEEKQKNDVENDPRYHLYQRNSNDIIINLLSEYNLDIFTKYDNMNLLHVNGIANNAFIIRYILDRVRQTHPERLPQFLNELDAQGTSPLLRSVCEGSEDAVKLLVEYGADIHLADLQLRSPIWVAASKGNINIVKFLIEKGANVNQFSISGKSPAFMAQMYKDEQSERSKVLDLLLENGGVIQGPVVKNGGKRKSRISVISKRKTSKKRW